MANEYHCAISNKFGFASDDDEYEDPRELIQKVSELAAKKKVEEKVAVKPSVPVKKQETSAPAKTENSRGRGNGRGRGGRGREGAGRPPRDGHDRPPRDGNDRPPREGQDGEHRRGGPRRGGERGERSERGAGRPTRGRASFNPNSSNEEVAKDNSFEDQRGEDRPRRRGGFSLGGPAGRGGGRGRGRQHDRQSGSDRTGVRSFDKKDGHGRGNWGDNKPQDELIGETENIAPEDATAEPEAPREKTAEELAWEAEQAELAKQKTLKEFKALSIVDAPKFNTRKAGEGATDNFGKLVPIKKEIIPDREEEEVVVIRKEPRKQIVDISITFAESNRGGFRNERGGDRQERGERSDRQDRGGRPQRGGRGGAKSGHGGRSGNNRSTVPFVNSTDAFPALGAH